MPRRIIADEIWKSAKVRQVQPPEFRLEYAWLIPLADDNGVFEWDPVVIWAQAYAVSRPSVTKEDVIRILNEFERVKLLYRYQANGKMWGFWIGIPLPKPSERYSKTPRPQPADLKRFLESSPISTDTSDFSPSGCKC